MATKAPTGTIKPLIPTAKRFNSMGGKALQATPVKPSPGPRKGSVVPKASKAGSGGTMGLTPTSVPNYSAVNASNAKRPGVKPSRTIQKSTNK